MEEKIICKKCGGSDWKDKYSEEFGVEKRWSHSVCKKCGYKYTRLSPNTAISYEEVE